MKKWISVKEKLPEPGKEVLVLAGDVEYPLYDIAYRGPGRNHKWMVYGGTEAKITHWMPLPEPPENKRGDKK